MTPFIGALLLVACGGLVPSQGAVIELDDNSFYDYAKERDVLLVDFYAPWCSDCKNLEPDFQAAGASLGARSIDLAKVDCFGAGKGLCTKYGIKRWPTLKNFNRGTFTGDYTGGLSAGEIAGYVNTVENSASPQVVSNPYAAPYTPMVMQTQQCVTRCKISKITNKAPCFAKCKAPKAPARKMLPQPVINEKSCAKCRQPQIAGKFSRHCPLSLKTACRRRHRVRRAHKTRAKSHSKTADVTSKKATIGTLTAATNDNVVKLSMGEPLIVPPNAEHRRPRADDLVAREPKFGGSATKGTAFDSTGTGGTDETNTIDEGDKDTLRLINDAQDKGQPVLSVPARDKYIQIPPHDSGDKKTKLKASKQINYPLPKVPAKPFNPHKEVPKMAPKFMSIKVPPHDSGDLKTAPPNKGSAFAPPHKPVLLPVNRNLPNKLAFAKRVKAGPLVAKVPLKLNQPLPNAKAVRPNLERKNLQPLAKAPIGTDAAQLLPMAGPMHTPVKKGMVKVVQQPLLIRTNGTGLFNAPLTSGPKQQVPSSVPMDNKIVALNRAGPLSSGPKKLESMSPREALKVPYDADDKKSTILED